jgi:hypothetical protein
MAETRVPEADFGVITLWQHSQRAFLGFGGAQATGWLVVVVVPGVCGGAR